MKTRPTHWLVAAIACFTAACASNLPAGVAVSSVEDIAADATADGTADAAADDAADAQAIAVSDTLVVADTSVDAGASVDAADVVGADATEAPVPCPSGVVCVTTFPFSFEGDTAVLPVGKFDTYSCKPGADESGPEQLFRVTVPQGGLLSAAVHAAGGVDVDVHILAKPFADQCLDRGDRHARVDVQAGEYWLAVDTYVSKGKPLAGKYHLDLGFTVPSQGPCEMLSGEMARVNDGGKHLPMPATGPIVLEAHLVTDQEPPPYPQTPTEELAAHHALSQAMTGLVMYREQVWAPKEGGGTFYGAGIFSPTTFPVLDEAWYVNMYWTKDARPKAGTRMILRLPNSPRAVVVSAGHETGPGNLAHIGGTPEESHFYLKTGHLSVMQLGIAKDQTLPFGPRVCQ